MALSDCEKCWDTPCECGWYFKGASEMYLAKHITSIFNYQSKETSLRVLEEVIKNIKRWKEDENRNKV